MTGALLVLCIPVKAEFLHVYSDEVIGFTQS